MWNMFWYIFTFNKSKLSKYFLVNRSKILNSIPYYSQTSVYRASWGMRISMVYRDHIDSKPDFPL